MTVHTEERATRGPSEHAVRNQIIDAARRHFSHYGYTKTTVADLAREIGFSKAYIYRFFESKQAIGEAICGDCTNWMYQQVHDAVEQGHGATDKLRRFAKAAAAAENELFLEDRKLHEIAVQASSQNWPTALEYASRLRLLLEGIIKEGRENGEFERKTALDETTRSIYYSFLPFIDPVYFERSLDLPPEAQSEIMGLVLRSLAP